MRHVHSWVYYPDPTAIRVEVTKETPVSSIAFNEDSAYLQSVFYAVAHIDPGWAKVYMLKSNDELVGAAIDILTTVKLPQEGDYILFDGIFLHSTQWVAGKETFDPPRIGISEICSSLRRMRTSNRKYTAPDVYGEPCHMTMRAIPVTIDNNLRRANMIHCLGKKCLLYLPDDAVYDYVRGLPAESIVLLRTYADIAQFAERGCWNPGVVILSSALLEDTLYMTRYQLVVSKMLRQEDLPDEAGLPDLEGDLVSLRFRSPFLRKRIREVARTYASLHFRSFSVPEISIPHDMLIVDNYFPFEILSPWFFTQKKVVLFLRQGDLATTGLLHAFTETTAPVKVRQSLFRTAIGTYYSPRPGGVGISRIFYTPTIVDKKLFSKSGKRLSLAPMRSSVAGSYLDGFRVDTLDNVLRLRKMMHSSTCMNLRAALYNYSRLIQSSQSTGAKTDPVILSLLQEEEVGGTCEGMNADALLALTKHNQSRAEKILDEEKRKIECEESHFKEIKENGEDNICAICQEPECDAILQNCMHMYCTECLEQYMKTTTKNTCPVCREPFLPSNIVMLIDEPTDEVCCYVPALTKCLAEHELAKGRVLFVAYDMMEHDTDYDSLCAFLGCNVFRFRPECRIQHSRAFEMATEDVVMVVHRTDLSKVPHSAQPDTIVLCDCIPPNATQLAISLKASRIVVVAPEKSKRAQRVFSELVGSELDVAI